MKKLLVALLIIVAMVLASGVTYAVTLFQVTHVDITIVPAPLPNPQVSMFIDQQATTPLTSNLHWGTQQAGTILELTLYAKNTGSVNTSVVPVLTPNQPYSWGIVTFTPLQIPVILPDQVLPIIITIELLPQVIPTTVTETFDITWQSE